MRQRKRERPWAGKNTSINSASIVGGGTQMWKSLSHAIRALPEKISRLRRPRVSHNTPFVSARYRLALINLSIVAGILAVMMVAVYAWEAHATDTQVNDQLTGWASHELQHASHMSLAMDGDSVAGAALPQQPGTADGAHIEQYEPSSPNIFYAILDSQGHVVATPYNVKAIGLPNVAAARSVLAGRQGSALVTVGHDDNEYRLYTVAIHDEDENGKVIGVLQAGISLQAQERQLHDLLLILTGVGLGALTLSSLASLFLAGRALRPMRLAFARQRQFTAAASHELRTPLAIMRSQAEVLARTLQRTAAYVPSHKELAHTAPASSPSRRGAKRPSGTAIMTDSVNTSVQRAQGELDDASVQRMREDVAELIQEVDYMTRLTRDLLVLARDAGDNGQIEWKLLSLSAITRKTVAGLQEQAKEHGLTLHLSDSAGEEPVYVRGDADRLRQLILALVENALRYTPAGGEVRVETRVEHGRRWLLGHHRVAQLIVSDTGCGIAPEDMAYIFEPFYRAPAARTAADGHDSAGLGLALVQWIVSAHRGDVTVSSRVGHGSTFTVSLPLAAPNESES
jgi:signal transduction histidine kinase